jgi:hypothetical protein
MDDLLIKYSVPILAGTLAISGWFANSVIGFQHDSPTIEKYLRANSEEIQCEIESKFNINIEGFTIEGADFLSQQNGSLVTAMRYDSQRDMISFPSNGLNMPLERDGILTALNSSTIKGIFIHEVGHDYTFQIMDSLRKEKRLHADYFSLHDDLPHSDNTRLRVSTQLEGIAEYFTTEMKENRTREGSYDNGFQSGIEQYEEGRKAMKPVLDKYGVQDGIELILSNAIITGEEIESPEKYLKRLSN